MYRPSAWKDNPRQGITIINQVAKEVAAGKKYILFPEGGYRFNNKNKVCDFKAGSFKIALKSHAPIVPIALIDSYKVFNSFHISTDHNICALFKTDLLRRV